MSIDAILLGGQDVTENLFSRVDKQLKRDKRLPGKIASPTLYRPSSLPFFPWGKDFVKSNAPMPGGPPLGSYAAMTLLLNDAVDSFAVTGPRYTAWWTDTLRSFIIGSRGSCNATQTMLYLDETASSPLLATKQAINYLKESSSQPPGKPYLVFSADTPLQEIASLHLSDDLLVKASLPSFFKIYGAEASVFEPNLWPRTYQLALIQDGVFHYAKEPNQGLLRDDKDLFSLLTVLSDYRKGNGLVVAAHKVLSELASRSDDKVSFYRHASQFLPHVAEAKLLYSFGRLPRKGIRVDDVLDTLKQAKLSGIELTPSGDLREAMDVDTLGCYAKMYALLDKRPEVYAHQDEMQDFKERFSFIEASSLNQRPEGYISHEQMNSYARLFFGPPIFSKKEVTKEALRHYASCTYDDIDALADYLLASQKTNS
ncbi:MAG: hypothetical protein ACMXYD_03435 [Candidatus Woesearchaeota archaeon]